MKYDTDWAKAKIQEIRGTVQVEGSVTAENLLQRGRMALADGSWTSANEFFDRALDTKPDSVEGWMGKLMAEFRCRNEAEMKDIYMGKRNNDPELVIASPLFEKVQHFADPVLAAKLKSWEADKTAFQTAETAARKKNEALRETLRRQRDICAGMVAGDIYHIVAVKSDGTVLATGVNTNGRCEVSDWTNVVKVIHFGTKTRSMTVGLRADGTVVTTCKGDEVERWKDVKHIYGDARGIAAVKKDGTVLYSGKVPGRERIVSNRKNIEEVYMSYRGIAGVRKDGTMICDHSYGQDLNWRDIAFCYVENNWPMAVASDRRLLTKEPPAKISSLDNYDRVVMAREENWGDLVWLGRVSLSVLMAGIRADGTMLLAQSTKKLDVSGWKLFGSIDTLEQEQAEMAERNARIAAEKAAAEAAAAAAEAARRAEEQRRLTEEKAKLEDQRQAYQTELANLKGLFTGKRRKELEGLISELDVKIDQQEKKIKELN